MKFYQLIKIWTGLVLLLAWVSNTQAQSSNKKSLDQLVEKTIPKVITTTYSRTAMLSVTVDNFQTQELKYQPIEKVRMLLNNNGCLGSHAVKRFRDTESLETHHVKLSAETLLITFIIFISISAVSMWLRSFVKI